jgi:urease accessory protein
MAHLMGRALLLAISFVAATLAGCALHVLGYTLPAPELAIALTVAAAAVLVAARLRPPAGALAALLASAGLFHGYAYGESIVGAEAAPLAAYMVGFGIIQSGVAVASALALRAAIGRDYMSEAGAMQLAGGAIAIVAAIALANAASAG